MPTNSNSSTGGSGTGGSEANASQTSCGSSSAQSSSLHHLSTLGKKITDAEILWTLKCVHSHSSAHANMGMNDLLQHMFTNSEIAQAYSLSESKFRYVTTFGLGVRIFPRNTWKT